MIYPIDKKISQSFLLENYFDDEDISTDEKIQDWTLRSKPGHTFITEDYDLTQI